MGLCRFLLAATMTFASIAITPSMAGNEECRDCPHYGGILTCDPQTCDWLLLNQYWVGNLSSEGELLISFCPIGYCISNDSGRYNWIPRDSSLQSLNDFLCNGSNRMGAICGQCQPGYAPAINSDTSFCVPCDSKSSKVNWIYYLLAVYFPLLVVFLVIIIFNIRLATGPLNSFIIFAQVISTTVDINQSPLNLLYGRGTSAFVTSYEIPYGFFNLNLFANILEPFCLHNGLDTLGTLALRYVEAFFPVLIMIVILQLVKCQKCIKIRIKCPSFARNYRIGSSMVHGFAAFVLLSYNRLCEITAYLLTTSPLFDHTLFTKEKRVFFEGNYSSDDSSYIFRYKLSAWIMMVVLVLTSIALLHYPVKWLERLISKVSWLRKVYPTASIAILLDTFQGCFRDNRRYFAGLYLALRLMLFSAFTQPFFVQLLMQQILFIVYMLLIAILSPYKEKYLNYLDISIFADLALINIFTWYTMNQIQFEETLIIQICILIESILTFLPMLYFITYLLWHFTRRYHEGTKRKLTEWYHVVGERFQRGTITPDVPLTWSNAAHCVAADDNVSTAIDRSGSEIVRS